MICNIGIPQDLHARLVRCDLPEISEYRNFKPDSIDPMLLYPCEDTSITAISGNLLPTI